MRTTADRIRHTLLFEIIALIICTPIASWVLDRGLAQIGTLGIALSLTAMAVNYAFNLVFDLVINDKYYFPSTTIKIPVFISP